MKIICVYPDSGDIEMKSQLSKRLITPLIRYADANITEVRLGRSTRASWAESALKEKPDAVILAWWGRAMSSLDWTEIFHLREAGIPLMSQCMDRQWDNISLRWQMALRSDCFADDVSPLETLWPSKMAHTRIGLFTAGAGEALRVPFRSAHISSSSDTQLGLDWARLFDALGSGRLCIVERTELTEHMIPPEAVAFFHDSESFDEVCRRGEDNSKWAASTASLGYDFYQGLDREKFWKETVDMLVSGKSGNHSLSLFSKAMIDDTDELEPQLKDIIIAAAKKSISVPSTPMPIVGRIWCHHPWYGLEYDINGNYGPCCFIRYLGKGVVPDTIKEMMGQWNSEEMRQLRKKLVEGNVQGTSCETCSLRYLDSQDSLWGMTRNVPRVSTHKSVTFDIMYQRVQESYQQGKTHLDFTPLSLYALTSEGCNMRCIMCMQNHSKKDLFPVARLKKLLTEIGMVNLDRFGFVGGEIFINKDSLELLEFVKAAQPSGTCILLLTNGAIVDRFLDDLKQLKNLLYIQSIDGYGPHYEAIRCGGRWDRVVENLRKVVELARDKPEWKIYVNSLIMTESLPCPEDIVKFIDCLGAYLFFMPIVGGHVEQDFFTHPELLPEPKIADRYMLSGLNAAHERGANRAEHSLEAVVINWATKARFFFNRRHTLSRMAVLHPVDFALMLAKILFPLGPAVPVESLRHALRVLRTTFSLEVTETFALAVEGGPKSRSMIRCEWATILMKEGQLDHSIELLEEAESLSPTSSGCLLNRARYLRTLGENDTNGALLIKECQAKSNSIDI